MPTKDSPNQITAMTAAAIMFEMICLIAESCQKTPPPPSLAR